jgi:hypothetical protein
VTTANARVDLRATDSTGAAFRSLRANMSATQRAAVSLRSALAGIGAGISVAAVRQVVISVTNYGDALNKAGQKAGIGAEAISELAFAAKQSGVELGALSTSLRFMQRGLSEAASGTGEARVALAALGLSLRDLQGLSPDKQFELLADRISKVANPADKARAAMMLFGRAGADLIPLMEGGAESIRKLREQAQQVGQSFSQDQLNRLTAAKDSVSALKTAFSSFATVLVAEVAPALTDVFNKMAGIVPTSAKVLDQQIANAKAAIESFTRSRELQDGVFGRFQPWTNDPKLDAELKRLTDNLDALIEQRGKLANLEAQSKGAGALALPGFEAEEKATKAAKEVDPFISLRNAYKDILSEGQAALQAIETPAEKIRREFDEQRFALEKLAETYPAFADAAQEALTRAAVASQDQLDALGRIPPAIEAAQEQFSIMATFAEQAARNIQDAFAAFLFDPFKDGLRGMLKGFIDVIRQMVAQVASTSILRSLFSGLAGAGGGLGSFGASLLKGLEGRASGGPVSANKAYVVGENGPELLVGASGRIIPNGGGGGMTVAPVYNIDARGATQELVRALPGILAENNRRIVESMQQAMSRSGMRAPVF